MRAIDGTTRLRRVKGPAGAIGIEGDGQALRGEDRMEGAEHRRRRLGRPELRVEQPLGGVVEDTDEGRPDGRRQGQPGMRAAVEMEEVAETGGGLAAQSVPHSRLAVADG